MTVVLVITLTYVAFLVWDLSGGDQAVIGSCGLVAQVIYHAIHCNICKHSMISIVCVLFVLFQCTRDLDHAKDAHQAELKQATVRAG
jgi:hypothetical protein